MYYIYSITNNWNNRKYYGQTSNIKRRLAQHKSALKAGRHKNEELQKDYNSCINRYKKKELISYDIIFETDTKEKAGILENLCVFDALASKEKPYNILLKEYCYILNYIKMYKEFDNVISDNLILYCYYTGVIGIYKFKEVCKTLNRAHLLKITGVIK